MIRAAEDFHEEFVIQVLSRTGLRKGEFYHLTANWIDWRQNQITVPRQQRCTSCTECIKDENGPENTWTPKTENSPREIGFIDAQIQETLNDYFGNGVLTVKENYSRTEIWRIVKHVARRVDQQREIELENKPPLRERAYPHSLRAAFASYYAEKGVTEQALMDTMGWGNISVAKDYITSTGRAGKEATRKIREDTEDFIGDF